MSISNITLVYDPTQETKTVIRKTTKDCKTTQYTEQVTECYPPYPCKEGEKMVLFLKDPTKAAEPHGMIVASIIYRRLIAGKYEYLLQYDNSATAEGVGTSTLTQCDVLKVCCYNCAMEYYDKKSEVID